MSVELVYCTSLDAASAILSDGFPDGDVWSPHLQDGFADEAILEVEFDDLEEEDLGVFAVGTRFDRDGRDRGAGRGVASAERGYRIPAHLVNSLGKVRLVSPRAEDFWG